MSQVEAAELRCDEKDDKNVARSITWVVNKPQRHATQHGKAKPIFVKGRFAKYLSELVFFLFCPLDQHLPIGINCDGMVARVRRVTYGRRPSILCLIGEHSDSGYNDISRETNLGRRPLLRQRGGGPLEPLPLKAQGRPRHLPRIPRVHTSPDSSRLNSP